MQTLYEPGRDLAVYGSYDVLVIGGGPSGVCAAVSAARLGMNTLLIEKYGFLGGMWTAGLVLTLAGFNSWLRPYQRCVKGIPGEWLSHAAEQGFAEDNSGWVLNSDPEGMKKTADDLVLSSGAEILFHTLFCAPIMEGKTVKGVIIENRDGRQAVLGKTVIDCTGNGDVFYLAGTSYTKGKALQPLTLAFDLGNVFPDPAVSHTEPRCLPVGPEPAYLEGNALKSNASRRLDIHFDYDKFNEDYAQGLLPPFGGPWTGGLHKHTAWMNTVRVAADASSATQFSQAEVTGRRNAFALWKYFSHEVPGFENSYIQRMAAEIGVRETRQLDGVYRLTKEDVTSESRFEDAVGLGCWSIDIHPSEAKANHSMYVPKPYQFPYRIMVPKDTEGLLAAGRSVSVDREAMASMRVGATCAVTGQAAGAAAALSSQSGKPLRDIDIKALQRILLDQQALLTL